MNIKGPTRCPNTIQEPVTSINSKKQQKSVTKLPNHDKIKLCVFSYSTTTILLST